MSSLLYEAKLNKLRGFTIFGSNLKIYEDYITFKQRKWFNVDEITMTTSNIAQINLRRGILFSTIQIINSSGAEDVVIHHVWFSVAAKTKAILDQKLYQIHTAGVDKAEFEQPESGALDSFEKSLNRMHELVRQGKMTEKEYEQKRKQMLGGIE